MPKGKEFRGSWHVHPFKQRLITARHRSIARYYGDFRGYSTVLRGSLQRLYRPADPLTSRVTSLLFLQLMIELEFCKLKFLRLNNSTINYFLTLFSV